MNSLYLKHYDLLKYDFHIEEVMQRKHHIGIRLHITFSVSTSVVKKLLLGRRSVQHHHNLPIGLYRDVWIAAIA